jgi:hypothetical protein
MVTSLTAAAVSLFSRSRGCETGQSSPENVTCCMFVGVESVPAPPTGEHRLAGAVLLGGVPAGFTAVGGMSGVHLDHHTSSLFRFGAQDRYELSPAGVMDASVQAGLGGGPVGQEPALMVGIRPGAGSPDHVPDLQVLHDQQAMVGDERPGRVMVEVAALVGELAVPGRDRRSGSTTVVRTPLLAGQGLLSVAQLGGSSPPPSQDWAPAGRRRWRRSWRSRHRYRLPPWWAPRAASAPGRTTGRASTGALGGESGWS